VVTSVDRQVLMAPDIVARVAASAVRDRRQRWMLRQPREVRVSYARRVHGRLDEDDRAMAWMLGQPFSVRESFVAHVLGDRDDREAREQRWMLLADDGVRAGYVRAVLGGEPI
jgi:hypothetical protein